MTRKRSLKPEEADAVEIKEGFEMVSYRLAVPMSSRSESEVLAALHEMYMQLRILGYPLTRLHSDRAREFTSKSVISWCRNRNIIRTTTAAQSSQQNGRAERRCSGDQDEAEESFVGCRMEPGAMGIRVSLCQ